uniref:Uncharacterized protein n=2 Tax=Oryza meridionalis TaxID=40149 RepID=A0A0E0CWQ1_9ORYZ
MGISESDELRAFEATGIYRLAESGATFLDPVRILNASYRRFRLVPSAYYSRSFGTSRQGGEAETERTGEASPERKKRKRQPKPRELNEVERMAEARHQEARPLLLSAHKSLLKAKDLLEFLPRMIKEDVRVLDVESNLEKNLVELGSSWRAPFCEMTLCFQKSSGENSEEGICLKTSTPLFNSTISIEENDDAEGEFQDRHYILPRRCCFLMTDLKHVRGLIPDNYNQGYNLIVVDPPWENGCVRQKVAYPTLPNRHFLYLPVQELAHSTGALLVLWITNREKLWKFVEEELFPAWGVKDHTVFYWLKVKPDGSLIGNLDLLHHRPYECLLVGYINLDKETVRGSKFKFLEERRVLNLQGALSFLPESWFLVGPLGEMNHYVFRMQCTFLISKSMISPMVEVDRNIMVSMAKAISRVTLFLTYTAFAILIGGVHLQNVRVEQQNGEAAASALCLYVWQRLCVTARGVGPKAPNPLIPRRAEAVAPAADRDVQPDAADLVDATVNPNDASAPARAFGSRDVSRQASQWLCRQGQFRPLTDVSKNPYYEPIIPAPAPNHCNCRAQRLASEMPGLRPESPAIPSPELRRVRTSFTGASSWVATTAMGKVVRSAKAPVEPKVEEVEKQRRRGKGGCNGTISLARRRSPPPSPVSPELGKTRCSWITANSEPLYVAFHDEEWGVPVHDDQKLFELLTLSQALAEITWPIILNKREEFREMFDGFNYASVSEFTDKKVNLLSKSNGNMLLSEQKIRAVVTNAKQMHKVIQDFGSFSNYCWSFVKHKPVKSNFRYARQVPIKTPKSEAISKDLMRRGFQCVGPTTIYSFMQVSGIINDHLSCCFRFQDCRDIKRNLRAEPGLIERRLSSPPSSEDSETSREA